MYQVAASLQKFLEEEARRVADNAREAASRANEKGDKKATASANQECAEADAIVGYSDLPLHLA